MGPGSVSGAVVLSSPGSTAVDNYVVLVGFQNFAVAQRTPSPVTVCPHAVICFSEKVLAKPRLIYSSFAPWMVASAFCLRCTRNGIHDDLPVSTGTLSIIIEFPLLLRSFFRGCGTRQEDLIEQRATQSRYCHSPPIATSRQ